VATPSKNPGRTAPGRVSDVRRANLALILSRLEQMGSATRAGLAESTGLTKASVSSLVAELAGAGLLHERGFDRGASRGRPGLRVSLNPAAAALGMEVNVDYVSAAVIDLSGELRIHHMREERNAGRDPREVLGELMSLVRIALKQVRSAGLTVYGATLAVPGLVDQGLILQAPNLGWRSVDVREWLGGLLPGAPIAARLVNEANSAALAELWYGHGRQLEDYLFISGQTGVGGGVVIGSDLFTGPGGQAGEIGHLVVEPAGPECSCGGFGCLERYAGQTAMLQAAGITDRTPAMATAALTEALSAGDPIARDAVACAGHYLGVAAASSLRLLNVPSVVLGGQFPALRPWLVPALAEALDRHAPGLIEPSSIVASELGSRAAVMGAAGSVIRRTLREPHELTG
jgi:predicted NBD/HSP70 family sugar kinase